MEVPMFMQQPETEDLRKVFESLEQISKPMRFALERISESVRLAAEPLLKLQSESAVFGMLEELGSRFQPCNSLLEMEVLSNITKEWGNQFHLFKLSPEMERLTRMFEDTPVVDYRAFLPIPEVRVPVSKETMRQVIREEIEQALAPASNAPPEPLYGSDGIKRRPGFAG
jgi:predicted transcriptional regulator with HTH domain